MSAVDLEKVRGIHAPVEHWSCGPTCQTCEEVWPCCAIQLADEVERLRLGESIAQDSACVLEMQIYGDEGYMDQITRLRKALDTIAGGYTDRFSGAPDIMSVSPEEFRSGMWTWSQKTARAALQEPGEQSEGGGDDG